MERIPRVWGSWAHHTSSPSPLAILSEPYSSKMHFCSVFFRIGSNPVSNLSRPKRILCHRFVMGCQDTLFLTSHPPRTKLICIWAFAAKRPPFNVVTAPVQHTRLNKNNCNVNGAGNPINAGGAKTPDPQNMQISFGRIWAFRIYTQASLSM